MTQKHASQETVPGPVGDRRFPLPGVPRSRADIPTPHQFSAPALELAGSDTPPSQAELAPVLVQILSLRKELRAVPTGCGNHYL